jgi:hypothetical protein
MVNMSTPGCHWHLRVQKSSHMKQQTSEEHGHHMEKMDGTLAPPWKFIDATRYTLVKQEVKGL